MEYNLFVQNFAFEENDFNILWVYIMRILLKLRLMQLDVDVSHVCTECMKLIPNLWLEIIFSYNCIFKIDFVESEA